MSSDLIAELADALEEVGEDVILRRPYGTGANQRFVEVKVRAVISEISAQQVSAGIPQNELNFIMSPTQINEKQWPGGVMVKTDRFQQDPRIPVVGIDQIVARGKPRILTAVTVRSPGNEIVRIEGRISG